MTDTTPRRGQVWLYRPVVARQDEPDYRLVVSNDIVNDTPGMPTALIVRIVPDDPGGLLSVRIDPHGWALALTVQPVVRSRLVEFVRQVDDETIDDVATALRAVMDL